MHTGFCSPSSTRSFGATPFDRNSLNWSAMYCVGFFFVVCVAVSDIRWLLWNEFARESYFAPCGGLGANCRAFAPRFLVTAVRSRILGISLSTRWGCAPSWHVFPESVHKSEASSPTDNAKVRAPGSNTCAESHAARTLPPLPSLPHLHRQLLRKVCPRGRTKLHHRYGGDEAGQ